MWYCIFVYLRNRTVSPGKKAVVSRESARRSFGRHTPGPLPLLFFFFFFFLAGSAGSAGSASRGHSPPSSSPPESASLLFCFEQIFLFGLPGVFKEVFDGSDMDS